MKFNYKEIVRYLLVALALFFGPILIPVFVTILVVALTVSGCIVALCLMFGAMFMSFLIGIVAVPVLLSTVVTISFYIFFKIVQSSLKKFGRFKLFVWLGNKLPKNLGCIPISKILQFKANLAGKIQNCIYQEKKELTKTDSWGNIPSFKAEMEEESKHLTIPPVSLITLVYHEPFFFLNCYIIYVSIEDLFIFSCFLSIELAFSIPKG